MQRKTSTFILTAIAMILFIMSYAQRIFEGVITYQVKVELKDKNYPYNDYLKEKYGKTLKLYVDKNGNQKREYFGSGSSGLDWAIYQREKNEYYSKWNSMDTVFYYNCGQAVTNFKSIENGNDINILGKNCKTIVVKSFEPKEKENIVQMFSYSEDLQVSNNAYSDFKDGYLDKVYETMKSHWLKWVFEQKHISVTFEAIKIELMELDQDKFKIPSEFELVRM